MGPATALAMSRQRFPEPHSSTAQGLSQAGAIPNRKPGPSHRDLGTRELSDMDASHAEPAGLRIRELALACFVSSSV